MGNYTYLSITGRRRVYTFLEIGLSVAKIAKKLHKHRLILFKSSRQN